MVTTFRRPAAAFVAAGSAFFGLALLAAPAAHAADPTDIVINEMMTKACPVPVPPALPVCTAGYTPVDAAYEFIELYNRGPDPIDISGWGFTFGIGLDPTLYALNGAPLPIRVFPSGTIIPSHTYFVGSSNVAVFNSVSGQVADFSFAGTGLSSGGETVTLVDAAGTIVEALLYAAVAPWPSTPNGLGPSLELTDPFANPANGGNWGVSATSVGTPHAQNSSFGAPPPNITGVTANPFRPTSAEDIVVQATLPKGLAGTLTYKVMFGSDTPIAFLDNAASVGGANDGTYSAVIPKQGAGQLVRYKISVPAGAVTLQYPGVSDSRGYDGVVVQDPSLGAAQLPVLEWFLDDASYNQLAQPVCDGVNYTGVLTWQGKVYDNATFRRRGHSSCLDAKPKVEMQLPAGYAIDFNASVNASLFAEPMSGLIDEFALQSDVYPIPGLGWDHIGDLGDPTVGYLSVRVQRNAAFWAAGAILEEYDGSWRGRNGRNDGAFYKAEAGGFRTYASATDLAASLDFDKKDPDDGDYSDIWQLTQVLNQSASPTKTAWIWANINVPEMVEYMAVTTEIRHWDSGGKNYYVYRDASSTGRWEILHWDLDGIFSGGSDTKGDFVTPDITSNKLYKSLFEVPEIKDMYFRRLRSLHDEYLTIPLPSNPFASTFAALTTPNLDADRILDKNKWGGGGNSLSSKTTKVNNGVTERRTQIAAHTNATEVPTSQTANPNVVINEIQYNPGSATGNEEFLELHNPSATEAVDISGWVLTGVGPGDTDWTIPNGTVIPKGGYVVFVSHDADFRTAYPGDHFVGGQFTGGLSSTGETITLKKGATVIDSVSYSPLAPWPTTPDGTGPSLELKNPTLDNSLDTSWLASTNTGTPNAKNTAFGGGGGGGGTGCSVANPTLDFGDTWCHMATGGDLGTTWRAEAFDDSAWPSGPGMLGFKNTGLATTIPATNGRSTYYFRTDVNVADASTITSATLNAVLDDAAVVYVNGTEAGRANLAAGVVGFTQKALVDVTGAAENTPIAISLLTGAFHTGTNTIAVEVHNKGNAPGDLGLDAELKFNTGGGGGGTGVVLDYGATWKYLDTGLDQGTAWRAEAFTDTAWASGPGSLGFGNTPLGTTLTKAQKRTTYYFRGTFNVTGTVNGVTLDLLRDDGAVVYINGVEVARSNMPAGTVVFATQASTEITGTAEKNAVSLTLPTANIHTGTNSIAIEIHQFGNAAGDLSMDARLTLS